MNWFFRREVRTLSRGVRRRFQGQRPVYGDRNFPWHRPRQLNFLRMVLAVGFVSLLLLASFSGAAAAGGYSYYSRDLPSVDLVFNRRIPQSTLIYDRNGNLLDEVYDPNQGHRILVPLREMGQNLVNATLAAEDPNFYTSPGVDPTAVARAVFLNLQGGGIVSGASTLTMQLIRNTLFTEQERTDRSLLRKVREAILAFELATRYNKNDILELYLNDTYYGHQTYGAEAAALQYFGKHAKDLSVPEAAMLAGMPQAPSDYDPYVNPDLAVRRQYYVLDQMVKYGFLTRDEAEQAKQTTIYLGRVQTHFSEAPHFALYVRDLLVQRFGYDAVYYGGLRVVTSLDLQKQNLATKSAQQHVAEVRASHASDAAVVSIDPKTGEVLAMVGSVDFYNDSIAGQVNMAIAARQPGSSIKPFTYLTAYMKLGYIPATMVDDRPIAFPQRAGLPPYRPLNWNFVFNGWVPLRTALAASMNIPAVQMLANEGIPSMIDTAHKLGITTINKPPDQYGLAITLGAAEVRLLDETFAYTMFDNNGLLIGEPLPLDQQRPGYAPYGPVVLKSVTNFRGDVLYQHTPQPPIQVVPAEYAYLITASLMEDQARVLTYGLHSYLELSRPNTAKTGTTENRNDSWTLGYTPDLVTGVWVGNADNSPMIDVAGVSGAGKIWHDYMEAALKDYPKTWFTVPPKIKEGNVCGTHDVYIEGREPVCIAVPLFAEVGASVPQPAAAPAPQGNGG